MGQDVYRGLEKIFGPIWLSLLKHPFAHDMGARTREHLFDLDAIRAILLASFAAVHFPEGLLAEHPMVYGRSIVAEWIGGAPVLCGQKAVQRNAGVEKYLTHKGWFVGQI